jgi:hypothetical protein
MADPDFIRLLFGDPKKTPEEQEIIPPVPVIPPLPDIQALLSRVRRQVDKAKTLEVKTGYIDIGIAELKQIKDRGERQYHTLTEQDALDDPQPFLDYNSDLDEATNELCILRMSLQVKDADCTVPGVLPPPAPSTVPIFTALAASVPTTPDPKISAPDVMDVNGLGAYLKVSPSQIYKTYKSEGIPYFLLGTLLRFRKEEIDVWIGNRGKAGLSVTSITGQHSGTRSKSSSPSVPAAPRGISEPGARPIELHEDLVHPQKLARINKLIALLWERDYLSQSDSQRFKNWVLRGTKLDSGEEQLLWTKLRKSLVTCIVLLQHAGLISIRETKGKTPPRPDYAARIERDFTAEGKSRLQNIDRDLAKDIEEQILFFTSYLQVYAKDNKLDFPLENILFSALNEYFDDIDGSEGLAEEVKAIADGCKSLDFDMLRLFHSIAAS